MGERGTVHTYQPSWTERDPNDPTKRILKRSPNWAYSFSYRRKPYQKSGFKTRTEARNAGLERLAEAKAGHEEDWRKFTMQGLYLLAAARKAEWDDATKISFEMVWKRLFRFFQKTTLTADVDDVELQRFVEFRQGEGAAVNTILLDLHHLRAAMNLAHKKRRLPWVPEFPKLKRTRREQQVHPFELKKITAQLPRHLTLLLETAEEVGWRTRSELRTRQWQHVDWGPARWPCECQPALFVTDDECSRCGAGRPGWLELDAASCKTDRARVFPMTKRLRAILMRARVHVDEVQLRTGQVIPWVFCRPSGKPIGNYDKAWNGALARAGYAEKIKGRSGPWSSAKVVHDIRRTTIRRWKKAGIERDERMPLVGHADESTHGWYEEQGGDAQALRAVAVKIDQAREAEQASTDSKVVQLELFVSKRRG